MALWEVPAHTRYFPGGSCLLTMARRDHAAMNRRLQVVCAIIALITFLAWFCWWASTGHQVERTFTRLSSAVTSGSAGGVLDLIHPDYPIRRCWPQIGEVVDGDDKPGDDRRMVLRALTALFLLQRDNPLSITCRVESWTARDDGWIEAVATIDLGAKLGPPPVTIDPLLHRRSFILAPIGWWSLGFREHQPFQASF